MHVPTIQLSSFDSLRMANKLRVLLNNIIDQFFPEFRKRQSLFGSHQASVAPRAIKTFQFMVLWFAHMNVYVRTKSCTSNVEEANARVRFWMITTTH